MVGSKGQGTMMGPGKGARHCTDGAMMTLDLGMGSCLPSTVVGTFSRNPSSWRDRTSGLPSYQLPAWVASRVPCCGMLRVCAGVFYEPMSLRACVPACL